MKYNFFIIEFCILNIHMYHRGMYFGACDLVTLFVHFNENTFREVAKMKSRFGTYSEQFISLVSLLIHSLFLGAIN